MYRFLKSQIVLKGLEQQQQKLSVPPPMFFSFLLGNSLWLFQLFPVGIYLTLYT